MANKNIAVVQSLSCFGKSSLTIALPVLSAAGFNTSVIPTVMLSTHTGGFGIPEKVEINGFLNSTLKHWDEIGLYFDCLYSGYIKSPTQIDALINYADKFCKNKGLFLCDPAFADNGKLYNGFDNNFSIEMLKLCKKADIITPNLTEACLLSNCEYKSKYDKDYINNILNNLYSLTNSTIILTGLTFDKDNIITAVNENGNIYYCSSKNIPVNFHGAGDLFVSVLLSSYLNSQNLKNSIVFAMDFVSKCIEDTVLNSFDERNGIIFEDKLSLICELSENC